MGNQDIWERRYKAERGIAGYPYDVIVAMILTRFPSRENRTKVRVLDYGCGGGNHLWFLLREGFSAWGCDVAAAALKISRDRVLREGYEIPNERLNLVDEGALPYADSCFEVIIDRESLCQSNWTQIKRRVLDFERILVPGGWYLGVNFTDQHPDLAFGTHLGDGDYNNFSVGMFEGQGTRHFFSVNQIESLFRNWRIDQLSVSSFEALLGDKQHVDDSEYVIAAQKRR